jgi:hypothetical protein
VGRRGFSGRLSKVHDPLFDSAWLKWAQAVLHAEALQADIERIAHKADAYPVLAFRTEYYPKRHGFAVIAKDIAPIPVRWRLLLGDIANNYRAALDHLAWAIVSRGRTPPGTGLLSREQEKAVYFPLFEKRSEFNGRLAKKLPGARRADIAKVRRYQPYHYGPTIRSRHALPLMARINVGDKHRTIQPLWAVAVEAGMKITKRRDCVITGTPPSGRGKQLEVDAEIAFLHARKTGPDPYIEMELRITAEPSLDNILGVREWVATAGGAIMGLLFEFSAQPPEITDVGIKLA